MRRGLLFLVMAALAFDTSPRADPPRPQFGDFRIPGGYDPYGMVVADFNGDGRDDLAASQNNTVEHVAVMLGTPDGYLSSPQTLCCEFESLMLTTGHFNGDAHLDLAVAPFTNDHVTIYLGAGDGSFVSSGDFLVADFGLGYDIAAGELTGDGFEDVVVAGSGGDQGIWLVPGNGDGTLGSAQMIDSQFTYSVTVGHLDDDPHLDVASWDSVYFGDGLGGFTKISGAGGRVIADLNEDGNGDLADSLGTDFSVSFGNGDGTFAPEVTYPGGANEQLGGSVLAADMDNDGNLDLVAAGSQQVGTGISVLFGNGDGTFGSVWQSVSWADYRSIAVADLNDDSFPDVIASVFPELEVLLNNGDGTLLGRASYILSDTQELLSARTMVDVDLDGRLDFIAFNEGDVHLAYGNADGTTVPSASLVTLENPLAAAAGDFADNGSMHLAVLADPTPTGPAEKVLRTLFGFAGGTFSLTPIETPVSLNPSAMISEDVNGDGKPDILATDELSNELLVLLGQGSLLFAAPQTYPVGLAPVALQAGLLDGDSHPDLVVANRDSDDLSVFLGNGDGTFQPASFVASGDRPTQVALGDLNGDNLVDLVVPNTGDTTVRLGNGDGTFGADQRLSSGLFESRAVLGDFDRDGLIDLFVADQLFSGNGDGTFEFVSRHGIAARFAADFDEDGWVDLATGNRILLNQGSPGALGFEADDETMRWPGVPGADTYNVYRGDTSSLVDVDTNGLPDGDYGVCLSGSDPDLTDTIFTDTNVPATGGDGFFYIRSVVTGGSEDLGTTSAGLARSPTVVCP